LATEGLAKIELGGIGELSGARGVGGALDIHVAHESLGNSNKRYDNAGTFLLDVDGNIAIPPRGEETLYCGVEVRGMEGGLNRKRFDVLREFAGWKGLINGVETDGDYKPTVVRFGTRRYSNGGERQQGGQ